MLDRHLRALGGDAQAVVAAVRRDAHAAAHHDAVHEDDVGLGVGVDQVVEGVFLGEEVLQPRVARQHRLVEEADVAAGAEGAEGPLPAHAAHAHALDPRVLAPGEQRRRQLPDHVQRQRIQRLGPVQRDQARAAADFRHDFVHQKTSALRAAVFALGAARRLMLSASRPPLR
jgi:hypothetical protein